ncbi:MULTISPECIES: hypothetical protein [unclassified Mesorhizobium]|uniref:hypothetical protein n=1 Tax=unclassified Mesorhizobium TaxID=325217 RepID=UPI000F75E1F4|nr:MULTISPECIES: hypothetical protein [unclassified Mesorhizobium]AZO05364.1 hypothetical protein EJ068_21560 [Mesorhizobium sp. M2A.F.Ca.ET.043.02.1.1]RUW39263.1 hypothetical protein EOA37_20555 [Mesorhizobium sp. M2A.F.Ca.ET.015.02.1.1]RUW74927.1 hypothetical protein EOA28_16190 [Mesorhizobium sp. M2A.F.Ca.ET.067.02.1.1]RVC96770.1 hypothetical protein EN739_07420 [Mesorhizobium sp. M2A.F.Ca.ET.017.03.2.1]RVD10083.1 hypothetical protein EN753_07670 [Mesorhizobium sp. M2A.F.Ca.ET.029.05.1.1]
MLIASGFGGTIFYRCLDAPFVASMKRRLWNRGAPELRELDRQLRATSVLENVKNARTSRKPIATTPGNIS